jgi:hypothetical protein
MWGVYGVAEPMRVNAGGRDSCALPRDAETQDGMVPSAEAQVQSAVWGRSASLLL